MRSTKVRCITCLLSPTQLDHIVGMASPLVGIAGVNSLLFASYGISKRIISPFPVLSLKETAAAGAMAGAANAILASPGEPGPALLMCINELNTVAQSKCSK